MLNQLKHIGLSENEAKVYLAMLELGPSPVLEIATKAGINKDYPKAENPDHLQIPHHHHHPEAEVSDHYCKIVETVLCLRR